MLPPPHLPAPAPTIFNRYANVDCDGDGDYDYDNDYDCQRAAN